MKEDLQQFLKKKILLDTRSSWIYIGILEEVTNDCAVLSEVDVHDSRDSHTPKEVYVLESKVTGIKANRERVYVKPGVCGQLLRVGRRHPVLTGYIHGEMKLRISRSQKGPGLSGLCTSS